MKKMIRFTAAAAAVAAALTMASTASAVGYNPSLDFGDQGLSGQYNRVIKISPATKVVNVAQGEMVEFVDTATGQSFVWNFDSESPPFDLTTVAPAGVLDGQHVTVYVQADNTRGED
jgi:hypothetical protein